MLSKKLSFFLLLAPFVASAPAASLEQRQGIDTSTHCGQWDTILAGQYTLFLDQWGKDNANSGQSCANFVSLSGTNVAWKNSWTWSGGNGVKSYTNVNLNANLNRQLSNVNRIPASWSWSQSTQGSIVSNVAYDLFTSSRSGGSNENEIMVWLANFNAGPISFNWGADGKPVPVASNLSIAGHSWNLYIGSNGANQVYSFLPTSGTVGNFNGDLNLFLRYLTQNQGLSTSQFLTTVQGGTEATSGTATITSSTFSVSIA
ncbi:hypothetical protein AGABI2DRAFT_227728 [Agaricus bisporus var. bisporus H97]|uniref:hypothetical protein n=1 Tax=Agaricus bisporus var. bisporus (strain H97 / ATCC MYA-4626 / FGSC 10389) TaxID=936046 RepID=UPI00029F7FC9|nr:hypothetical protein AGABI2DRAFT_227728 [Agaricus bisporus var. bisporus H97]EKV43040.1 hypothetical protein AGABI2DRAFT_227728 [Agaricus bisporus var. bisporus H97]